MAYNVIKGKVEFSGDGAGSIEHMVDDHSDQTIEGTKTFSQMVTASSGLSASVFYGDGSGLSGVRLTPEGDSGAIQFNSAGVFGGTEDFKFDGTNVILQGAVSASYLSGSGENIFNITPGNINGTLNAGQINLGDGLEDSSNAVRLKLDNNSGISRGANGIKINVGGLATPDTVATEDLFIVEQGGSSRRLPLSSLAAYLDESGLTFHRAAGNNGSIQFKESDTLASSTNLTFDSSTNLLSTVGGRFETVTVDTTPGSGDAPLIVLDKGNASASYIEFKEEGTKFAEIKTTYNEQFNIRTTAISQGIYIQQGAGTLLQFLNGDTTFKTNDVTVEENLTINGDTNMSGTLNVNVDGAGSSLITLDKGENDNSEIEFKNNGITVAELYTNAGESVFLRSVALSIILRQGTDNVLTIDDRTASFDNRSVGISESLTVTGAVRGKVLEYFTHRSTPSDANRRYLRFNKEGSNIESSSEKGKLIAPYSGKLVKVLVRTAQAADSTEVSFHKGVDDDQNVSTTPTQTITETIGRAHTTTTFIFSSTASFDAGDIIGLSINPTDTPGDTIVTSVWEFDQNN